MTGGGESLWSIAFKFFNFAILLAILIKFGGKPLKTFLANRRNAIKETIDETTRILNEAEALKRAYEEKLAGLDAEIAAFKKTIISEVENEKTKIIAEATQFASKMKEQARLAYEQEFKEIKNKIKEDIAQLTVKNAEKLIAEKMNKADHEKMIEDFIVKLRSLN
jgi:F-type H+-transporting ATPase subunit b